MKPPTRILVYVGLCFLAALVYNWSVLLLDHPGAAAEAQAHELGWERDDMIVTAGGYSSSLFSWSSYLQFRSKSQPESGEILVRVRKPTAFQSWQLAEYVQGN